MVNQNLKALLLNICTHKECWGNPIQKRFGLGMILNLLLLVAWIFFQEINFLEQYKDLYDKVQKDEKLREKLGEIRLKSQKGNKYL